MTPLPPLTDPAAIPPEEQLRAVAAVLAAGLLRLPRPLLPPEAGLTSARQKSLESLPNELALPPDKSVTVHAG